MFETDRCPGCNATGTLTFRGQPRYGGGGRFPQRAQVLCRDQAGCGWRGSTLDVRAHQKVRPGRRAGGTADQGAGGA